jgi:hypothetical protein
VPTNHQPKCTLHLHLVPMANQPMCIITKGSISGTLHGAMDMDELIEEPSWSTQILLETW